MQNWTFNKVLETSDTPSELIPAATILLLRDTNPGIEVLMLRRNKALKAFGGAWVFPGGRVDPEDGPDLPMLERSKLSAIRETAEETGLDISNSKLATLSNWIPPAAEIRRFSTWFFIAKAPHDKVVIDDGEIHDFCWVKPRKLIEEIPRDDFPIMPPTYISLHQLAKYSSTTEAITSVENMTPGIFETRFKKLENGFVTCWEGDVAYETLDFDLEGPRRRLFSSQTKWEYLCDFS